MSADRRIRDIRSLVIRGTALCIVSAAALTLSNTQARADFKLCNRMSYVVEAAIGIDSKGTTATRGWFRLDPAQCRVLAQGSLTADRLLLHARALPVYGASPVSQNGQDTLCIAAGDFVIAAARDCRSGQSTAAFTEIKPTTAEDGNSVAYLAEASDYDDEQARLAGIQRLLVIAGYDAAPIDGVDGPKTQGALTKFLRDRSLSADTAQSAIFFTLMVEAAQKPSATGLTWCNDTPHKVMAAVGAEEGKGIVTRGWYGIEPGKCLHPDVAGTPRRVFSFAEAVDAQGKVVSRGGAPVNWGGNTPLCTRESKFEISDQGDCGARGLATSSFATVEFANEPGTTLRFKMP